MDGEEGKDRLVGSRRGDFIRGGPGKDRIIAGGGNDRVTAVDRKRDRVICGSGKRDQALVDLRDRIKGCERGARISLPGRHQRPQFKPLVAVFR